MTIQQGLDNITFFQIGLGIGKYLFLFLNHLHHILLSSSMLFKVHFFNCRSQPWYWYLIHIHAFFLNEDNQIIIWGVHPIFFGDLCPLPIPFYCIFKKEFSEIWSFMFSIFFEKLPKISKIFLKFCQLFQNRRKLLVLNQNWSEITILMMKRTNPTLWSFLRILD